MTAQAGDTIFLKQQLRQQLRSRRAALSTSERHLAAIRAAGHLAALDPIRRARRVGLYLEHGSELGTAPLLNWLWNAGKEVYVPKLGQDGLMHLVRLHANAPLQRNRHNIREPSGRATRCGARRMDVIILPLVGFDSRGNRLGTGGGYYDRLLAFTRAARKPLLIGYAFLCQQARTLPVERWDVRLDAVVTETGVNTFA